MKIFLSGSITDADEKTARKWRNDLKKEFIYDAFLFDSFDYFWDDRLYESKENRNFIINNLRHSDLVIVYVDDIKSIGTAQELAVANELRIPVLALISSKINNKTEIHPWIRECIDKFFFEYEELVDYIRDMYVSTCI